MHPPENGSDNFYTFRRSKQFGKISFPSSPFETPSLSRVATKGLVFQPFLHGLDKRWQNDYLSGAFLTVPTDSDVVVSFFRRTHRSEHAADRLP